MQTDTNTVSNTYINNVDFKIYCGYLVKFPFLCSLSPSPPRTLYRFDGSSDRNSYSGINSGTCIVIVHRES